MATVPKYSRQTSPTNIQERQNHLENMLTGITTAFNDSLTEDTKRREKDEVERSRIWTALEKQNSDLSEAIREQGRQMNTGFDKLAAKGEIRWPAILVTISVLLGVGGAIATVEHAIVEGRIRQLELVDEYSGKLMESKLENHEQAERWLHELGGENHLAIHELEQRELQRTDLRLNGPRLSAP